ncbi:DUF2059 domain-containing protein [Salipiger mucosus]|uniref:DUF2059 domain-containing protein n=1 Tax=Salipiger mucosus DSM 16094 TaxID=1123237 RepID=S9QER6_9RHOB|nr:DUF2059 domain-containing protein [Salipiger mucosus]EPX78407.1 hypothetical protein Salmuc_03516 [Salipiger mucosus DSM 16094]
MHLRLAACLAACLAAATLSGPVAADPTDDLLDALGLAEIVEIMREEGIDYGGEMAGDLMPGNSASGWDSDVERIYDTEAMEASVRENFRASFDAEHAAPLLEYFTSETGERVVDLELSARRAMIDDDVETTAREMFRDLDGTSDPRLDLLHDFVDANDLVEANVTGAMNASYQFYMGLVDGGALEMSETEILSEVWSQEDETRHDTREWLYAFLLMSYRPLEDETLEDYVEVSATEEGQAMNRALFAGFNAMYDDISYALGLAAAQQMRGRDL